MFGLFTLGVLLGAQRLGLPELVAAQSKSTVCRIIGCAKPDGPVQPGSGLTPEVHAKPQPKPPGNGWSGVGQDPRNVTRVPWPWLLGGAGVLVLIWFDVPSRLFGRKNASPAQFRRERETLAARKAAENAVPPPAEVVIAAIDPGLASKGMRLAVRDCLVTLRAGDGREIALDKTFAGTSDRAFQQAARLIRRRLKDPGFVAALVAETRRGAAYLDANPRLAGAERRQAELRALARALSGPTGGELSGPLAEAGHGSPG
ncbi:MAG TPA: hypothetical protein VGL93_30900 [Streptosporangiaceae bacterium]